MSPDERDLMDRDLEATDKFHPLSAVELDDLRWRQSEGADALETFLPSWNRASRDAGGGMGVAFGWYVLLAGLTGSGKTLLQLNLLAKALEQEVNTVLFSLEMSREQVITRLRPIVSGVDVTQVERGKRFDLDTAFEADEAILDLPGTLHLNKEPIWELEDIGAVMEVYAYSHDVRLFIVDYVQLVSPARKDARLFEAMSEVSSTLRYKAQQLDAVTVALSQLNRSATRERKQPPTIDGLFGSSRFAFDADQVLSLDYSRREDVAGQRKERTWIKMLKNRHGPAVDIPVLMDKSTLQFREAHPGEESNWPGSQGSY